MKFQADSKKVVRLGGRKYATFKNGVYETTDKSTIALLQNAHGVAEVKEKKAKSTKE